MKRLILILIYFIPATVFGGFYKCDDAGKVSYSDKPCDDGAKKIDIRIDNRRSVKLNVNGKKKNHKNISEVMANDRNIRKIKRKIKSQESEMYYLKKQLDQKLIALKNKKKRSANNQAGATWEESISNEMVAITNQYDSKITDLREELKANKDKLSKLK